jgi:acyl CoA:acetate/3-ketoacid CoA transferase alpha subunit
VGDKIIALEEAAAQAKAGASISIGGFTSQRHPTALLRNWCPLRCAI